MQNAYTELVFDFAQIFLSNRELNWLERDQNREKQQ